MTIKTSSFFHPYHEYESTNDNKNNQILLQFSKETVFCPFLPCEGNFLSVLILDLDHSVFDEIDIICTCILSANREAIYLHAIKTGFIDSETGLTDKCIGNGSDN